MLALYRSLVLQRVVGCDEDEDDDDEAIPAAVGSAEAIIITLIMRVCK